MGSASDELELFSLDSVRKALSQLNQRRPQKLSGDVADILSYIHLALNQLELMEKKSSSVDNLKIKILKHWMKNLRTFILCANDQDRSLVSLLQRINVVVQRLNPMELRPSRGGLKTITRFRNEAKCFEQEIAKGYIILSDSLQLRSRRDKPSWVWEYSRSRSSRTSTTDVLKITDSALENLEDFLSFNLSCAHKEFLVELAIVLKEEITFLRNLIIFALMQRVGGLLMEDLSTHLETVAIDTAHLSYMCQGGMDDKEMQSKILVLMQNTKPNGLQLQVYNTYIQVRTCSKTEGMNGDSPTIVMKNFIDSLVCSLWKILSLEPFLLLFEKDELQVLYEGLRFLRTILREQPYKFNKKLGDLKDVICDAGLIIFSHSQKDVKIGIEIFDLLARIKLISEEVDENFPGASKFNYPRTDELGFVDTVLGNLKEMANHNANSNPLSCVQPIQEELIFLRSFMGEVLELRCEQEELQTLWNRVVEIAYRIDFLTDTMKLEDIPKSFSTSFDSIIEDIISTRIDALRIFHGNKEDVNVKIVTRISDQIPLRSCGLISDEVVGFDDEAISVIDRLTRGSKQLQVVAIVGMAGIGKTTLATKVYNDPSILGHFHIQARYSVSQVVNTKGMLHELLNQIVPRHPDRYSEMTEQDLIEDLWRHLKGSRYLIFLDDVWDILAWNSLKGSLPDDVNGSRIIMTSRHRDVAPRPKLGEGPHFLRLLTNEESWKLLQKKLFLGNDYSQEVSELGMQIAGNCKGLPLTIIIVAGLLATMEQKKWKSVFETLHPSIISSTEQCMNTLELSYKHLPNDLKHCFLYFSAFPEDQEISVKRLIQLWIAEGFVRKTDLKSSEDIATDYIMDLISRSLVTVATEKSVGGVKTCCIHDLIHDFCLTKAKEEKYFSLLKGYEELSAFNEPCHLWRLCIYSKPKHFKESKLFCPRARSLLFFSQTERYERTAFDISFVFHIFKSLRVLDLGQIHLGSSFPSEMELLVQLKYLAVLGEMECIPSSIGKLSNLETLIVDSQGRKVSLPDTLWNLQKLRHLYMRVGAFHFAGFSLPFDNPDNSSGLLELVSFSGAIISSWQSMEKQLRKFPNIRRLKCQLFEYGDSIENCIKIVVPDFLSRLESLDLSPFGLLQNQNHSIKLEFAFPANLRKLTLSRFQLPWETISMISKLPNLEALKLLNGSFSGGMWDMEEGDFSKLRFLKMAALNIVSWTAYDDQFPCLEKLILERCNRLKEIPFCFENISTLQLIEIRSCSLSLANLAKRIQEEQMSLGNNLVLKVLFNPHSCVS